MTQKRKLPSYAYKDEVITKINNEMTSKGVYELLPYEVPWRDRRPELERRGYFLRERYQDGWNPSWLGTNIDPFFCEDSIYLFVSRLFLFTSL